ncbi:hypothetical protein O0544_12795 [Edwardsiella anguillarum]|nr:hypothetical protein [Edwardsiella anguillarum]
MLTESKLPVTQAGYLTGMIVELSGLKRQCFHSKQGAMLIGQTILPGIDRQASAP